MSTGVAVPAERATIERELVIAIRDCMQAGGKKCPELSSETVPLKDLEGFDSLCGIEVAVELESKLRLAVGDNPFVTGSGKSAKARSIREITDAILKGDRAKHA